MTLDNDLCDGRYECGTLSIREETRDIEIWNVEVVILVVRSGGVLKMGRDNVLVILKGLTSLSGR